MLVLDLIVLMQRGRNPGCASPPSAVAMLAGYVMAPAAGKVALTFGGPLLMVPLPLHYELGFDWQLFGAARHHLRGDGAEAIGDMTATLRHLRRGAGRAGLHGADQGRAVPAAPARTGWRSPPPSPCHCFAQETNGVIPADRRGQPRHVGLFIRRHAWPARLFPAVAGLVQRIWNPCWVAPP